MQFGQKRECFEDPNQTQLQLEVEQQVLENGEIYPSLSLQTFSDPIWNIDLDEVILFPPDAEINPGDNSGGWYDWDDPFDWFPQEIDLQTGGGGNYFLCIPVENKDTACQKLGKLFKMKVLINT